MTRPTHGIALPITITEVYDGDTITVQRTWTARVRLLDCWCPEIRTHDPIEKSKGLAARDHLRTIALGQPGTLLIPTSHADRLDDIQSMGRILGHVWVSGDDRSLSDRMVSSGHATPKKDLT